MLYREKLQEIITEIWTAYDNVGGLRDAADAESKEYFNKARNDLYNAAQSLMKHDDLLDDLTANMEL